MAAPLNTANPSAISPKLEVALGVAPPLEHCMRLMGPHGITQFAKGMAPDPASGTCLDDNARLLLAAAAALRIDPSAHGAAELCDVALEFVERAQVSDGSFLNEMDESGRFIAHSISDAAFGRAIWSCGTVAATFPNWRRRATSVLAHALPLLPELQGPHARAYACLGLSAMLDRKSAWTNGERWLVAEAAKSLRLLATGLEREYRRGARANWPWWFEEMTWGSARLPEALLRAGVVLRDARMVAAGLQALAFLDSLTSLNGVFSPIGNAGWCRSDTGKAMYDQQPIEACGMVDAWLAAYAATGSRVYKHRASRTFDWFLGDNTEGLVVAEPSTGGCHDGLLKEALNANMGAESTLSYVHAHAALTLAGLAR